jgi:hypothetical protein
LSIYRGAGGAGDAVADSSSEALLVRELAIEVQADADAAAASATAAAGSASTASTAATNAQTAETNAETAETNAETAEANAETAQAAAEAAQAAAETAQTAAELAETNAETAETNAETAASSATSSASAAATSATNASNSASSASTSATNASNSASAASTSASNASTSATNAASSASAASTSASNAATSETNAASSASSASSSASTATTQAGIATTQASNAASSASAASTSATNASNSASAASTSASNAATSATNAGNSATAAATSETNAAASAAAAAASYDNFDDRYLGSKSAAPTLDNDGNALVTGALYYNDGTVTPADKGMYVYDGTQWIAASAASTAILTVFKYTATAGQTTFTGADDNAVTLAYTAGSAIVTVNGSVMEIGTDVTASNGTSIVLAQAALVNDEVNIYAFATFNIANTYTQAQVDAGFLPKANPSASGNLTFTGTGNRIRGLFSGTTVADRVLFQTSTTDGNTLIGAIPNGAGNSAFLELNNVSDPTNSSNMRMGLDPSATYLQAGIRGTGTYLPLTMYTGGSERLRIDTSGNVGVNNTSPAVLSSTTQVAVKANVNGDSMFVAQNSNGLTTAKFGFQYTGGIDQPVIGSQTAHPLVFITNNTERLRIPSDAAGITFPATQSASSNANTLDDYEEGTWTPNIGGTATYNAGNIGRYTKIGRLVVISAIVQINQRGTGSQTRVSGLPFTVAVNGQGSIGYYDSIATSLVFIQPYTDTNSDTSVNFRTLTAAATSMGDANIFQNGTRIDFTVAYFTT